MKILFVLEILKRSWNSIYFPAWPMFALAFAIKIRVRWLLEKRYSYFTFFCYIIFILTWPLVKLKTTFLVIDEVHLILSCCCVLLCSSKMFLFSYWILEFYQNVSWNKWIQVYLEFCRIWQTMHRFVLNYIVAVVSFE